METDFLIIGSGIAGLTFALRVAPHGRTLIVTKKNRAESNTNYAQGGIAGVMSEDDDVRLHLQDTLTAGAGLCHTDAVETLVREGPERIRDLIAIGARFSTTSDPLGRQVLALGREGGHSRNRIVHAVDRTGWECERALLEACRPLPSLQILEHLFAVDLLIQTVDGARRCVGALVLDPGTGRLSAIRARATLLATGGCGCVFLRTTNPEIATGDGVAMAWRAGADIANMEFIQFHPTALCHPRSPAFLISEAVRGEGGRLRTLDGSLFMHKYDERGELAPRDIVARAIHAERTARGDPHVLLDITHLDADFVKSRFPTIYATCLEIGLDITREPIPVVPAAHYSCGGVATDLNGCTTVLGLYAAGEVACTGVHGANRLASNSLLEAMVFGHRAAETILTSPAAPLSTETPAIPTEGEEPCDLDDVAAAKLRLRTEMNEHVGIVRSPELLREAERVAAETLAFAQARIARCAPHPDLYELRNLAQVALLIVRGALEREESRGLHYRTDFPQTDDATWRRDTVFNLYGAARNESRATAR
jgi:L-aspartate oxidase